jgi:hypothetical protein
MAAPERRRCVMDRGIRGIVVRVRPELVAERLHAVAVVRKDSGETLEAFMPDREMSAILPRSLLAGSGSRVPVSLLATVEPILSRMTEGRAVRAWQFKERWFFSFQPWKGVRFVAEGDAVAEAGVPSAGSPLGHHDPEDNVDDDAGEGDRGQ